MENTVAQLWMIRKEMKTNLQITLPVSNRYFSHDYHFVDDKK
jgi:hypothetical protein